MTSLKVQHANEIMEGMVKALGDDEFLGLFKQASLKKEAGPALDAFTKAVNAVKGDAGKIDALWNQHQAALEKEENTAPGTLEAAVRVREAAKGGPGTAVPPAADDVSMADTCPPEEEEEDACDHGMAQEASCPMCGKAADFALNHLVKVADALDSNGFSSLANIVDEAMTKIAKKKKEEEEEKEEKKSKKSKKEEEKKSKKSKKEEEKKSKKKSK